jgi:hypothetical protein
MNLVFCYSLIPVTVSTEMRRYCYMMDIKLNSEPDPREELGFRQTVLACSTPEHSNVGDS